MHGCRVQAAANVLCLSSLVCQQRVTVAVNKTVRISGSLEVTEFTVNVITQKTKVFFLKASPSHETCVVYSGHVNSPSKGHIQKRFHGRERFMSRAGYEP